VAASSTLDGERIGRSGMIGESCESMSISNAIPLVESIGVTILGVDVRGGSGSGMLGTVAGIGGRASVGGRGDGLKSIRSLDLRDECLPTDDGGDNPAGSEFNLFEPFIALASPLVEGKSSSSLVGDAGMVDNAGEPDKLLDRT